MPSSPKDPYDSEDVERILDRLKHRVRHITSRSQAAHEYALAKKAADLEVVLADRIHTAAIGSPPPELQRAMRAPVGHQQLVTTYIHGQKVRTVINPIGAWRPDREIAVWKCLVKLVERYVA